MDDPRSFLLSLFEAAIEVALPGRCVPPALPEPPPGRTVVLGAGKASAAMAAAVEEHWQGPLEGLVVTRYGHAVPCRTIEVVEASHPVPDDAGREAAGRILELAQGLGEDDLALCLISGGGSALLALPASGLELDDKRGVTQELLRCGATIHEINAVRKHLSAIKGGRLAAACSPARVTTLAISDVAGDDPSVIASGPTVGDRSTFAEAREVLDRYDIEPPAAVREHLERAEEETPDPDDPRLERSDYRLIASPQASLEAAAERARAAGVEPVILSDRIEGEAREVARVLAAIARQASERGQPAAPPCVLLSGGETTVTVRGDGRGGRNTELQLALALALQGAGGIWSLAGDSDGIDGVEANAGALVEPATLARAREAGVDARTLLDNNDSFRFFEALGDLVATGPTLTNVNDFRAQLVLP